MAHGQHPLDPGDREHLGVELKFSDGQQQQENQIKAIRSFIAQRVDVIGVSPVVEDGWDTVFTEVKGRGIPLIVLDRNANVPDNLFSAFIGSDFVLEGQRACTEMASLLNNHGNIVELDGTVGSAPAIDRRAGFQRVLAGASGYACDWPRSRAISSAPAARRSWRPS